MIEVRVDDLAFWEGEAIARPVNAELGATTSLLRRLEQAAGTRLAEQLRAQEPLAVGSAVVTGAGALAVELLIHAVVQSDGEPVSATTVRRATMSALHRAEAWEIARLAFAPFGLGPGNLEPEQSAQVMLEEIRRHLAAAKHPREVTIVVENEEERAAFAFQLERVGA